MKKLLRAQIKKKRDSLSQKEIISLSDKIEKKLWSLPAFKKANTVMFYVSFGSEVFTHSMIKRAFKEKVVLVPYCSYDRMFASEITSFKDLDIGEYGILEPVRKESVEPEEIDMVIVPGLMFDDKCCRLGYGVGYYDVFLRSTHAVKVALAFDFQVSDSIPTESHDVCMDLIVTDKGVVRKGKEKFEKRFEGNK